MWSSSIPNDIIDNRTTRLSERVFDLLDHSESAQFALGYFFLSGLASYAKKLEGLKELRILIGNTTNRETIEQIAEGCRHLELIQEYSESLRYPKRSVIRHMEIDAAENLRTAIALMDQTEQSQNAIETLIGMIAGGQLKVRLHTKGRLQARAYIFNFAKSSGGSESGAGIIGSSNLTLSDVSFCTDLNVLVRGNENHAELVGWFERLWAEGREFNERLTRELKDSWAGFHARPYDVYMKSIFTLVRDRLEDEDNAILWDDDITQKLAEFQRVAVENAIQMIRTYGGAFVADVVGLGKSFVGAAIVKHFERIHHARPLIVCPAALVDMWERYNEVYHLNARVLSMGKLREDGDGERNFLADDDLYRNRDFVLIDESHNLRNTNTQRYRILEEFLGDGKRCCLLTATPRNKSAWDIYAQLKLFHPDDKTDIPVNPPSLFEFFRGVERGTNSLQELLSNILIRRTRRDILKWYGYDAETDEPIKPERFHEYGHGGRKAYVIVGGKRQFFPHRQLETIEYRIDEAYQGLYEEIRKILGSSGDQQPGEYGSNELIYARYGIWNYLLSTMRTDDRYIALQRAGVNLRGLMRILIFKRFESSVFAFRETIGRMLSNHRRFRQALESGIVPAGDEAQDLLNDPNLEEEQLFLDAARRVSDRYSATDFDLPRLIKHIENDTTLLERIQEIVDPITPTLDAKLQTLIRRMSEPAFAVGKCLIFTQYADTAKYLHENLAASLGRDDIEVTCSGDPNRLQIIGRFAPRANPESRRGRNDAEINLLVTTDAMSEGLNLQDCNKIVNYDLHWNPVRLIQRFGRIDRIGSEHESIYGYNFLPETGIEQQLGLRRVLQSRIQEIHKTIGEDAAILDPSEQLNENAMYAIYEKCEGLPDAVEDSQDASFGLNEATELLRQLKVSDPAEYERIASLPDGIRTAAYSSRPGSFVHCKAGRFQQLYLIDDTGEIISQDIAEILSRIKCEPDAPPSPLPRDHNSAVMRVMRLFSEDVKQREADRHHTVSLGQGQRYSSRELRQLYSETDDEDKRARINILDQAFRSHLPAAVERELNRLRRNHIAGERLYAALVDLYNQHSLRERAGSVKDAVQMRLIPTLVSSASLSGNKLNY